MEIRFKRLEAEELDRFIALRIRQLQEEGADAVLDLAPNLMRYYSCHMKDGSFRAWLAMNGDEIVGTGGISIVEKPPYYSCPNGRIALLSSVFTLPDYRRRGIASRILDLLVEDARKCECGSVQITASDQGVLLYSHYGFRKNENFMHLPL